MRFRRRPAPVTIDNDPPLPGYASMPSAWTRAVAKVVPTGTPVPFLRGSLRGKLLIAGAASSPGKGLRVPLNQVEPEQLAWANRLAQDVVFDVGASLGLYSLSFSQRCSHVYAFEPNVRCISYLWRQLKLNRVHNVTVVPVAVSDRTALGTYDPNYVSVASFGDSWHRASTRYRSRNRPNQF